MSDIEYIRDREKFKYRVCGIVIKDDKILTINCKDFDAYYLPGGHAEFGEDSKQATIREMLEETETNVTIEKTIAIVENFYIDKHNLNTHEISFYYLVKPENYDNIKLENYSRMENDKGKLKQLNFEWIKLKELKDIDFRPHFLKEKLAKKDYAFEHLIVRQ